MHRDCTCLGLIQPQLWQNNWMQAHISDPDVKLVFPNAVSLVTQTTLNIRPNAQHWMATQNKLNGIFVDYWLTILHRIFFYSQTFIHLFLHYKSFASVIWFQVFFLVYFFICFVLLVCLLETKLAWVTTLFVLELCCRLLWPQTLKDILVTTSRALRLKQWTITICLVSVLLFICFCGFLDVQIYMSLHLYVFLKISFAIFLLFLCLFVLSYFGLVLFCLIIF